MLVKDVNTTRRSEFAVLQCGIVPRLLVCIVVVVLLLLLLLLLLYSSDGVTAILLKPFVWDWHLSRDIYDIQ